MQLRSRKKTVNYSDEAVISADTTAIPSQKTTNKRKQSADNEQSAQVTASSASQINQQHQQPAFMSNVSVEVWQMIISELNPSPLQLCRLSAVCRAFRYAADSHPQWRVIAQAAKLSYSSSSSKQTKREEDDEEHLIKRQRYASNVIDWKTIVIKSIKSICTECFQPVGRSSLEEIHDHKENLKRSVCIAACFRKKWREFTSRIQLQQQQQPTPPPDNRSRITKGHASGEYQIPMFAMGFMPYQQCRNPYYRNAAPMCLYKHSDLEKMRDFLYGSAEGLAEYKKRKEEKAKQSKLALEEKRKARKEKVLQELGKRGFKTDDSTAEALETHCGDYIKSGSGGLKNTIERYCRYLQVKQLCIELDYESGLVHHEDKVVRYVTSETIDFESIKEFMESQAAAAKRISEHENAQQ